MSSSDRGRSGDRGGLLVVPIIHSNSVNAPPDDLPEGLDQRHCHLAAPHNLSADSWRYASRVDKVVRV